MPVLPPPTPRRQYPDPSDEPIECEVCGNVVRLGDSFSFVLGWGTTGPHNIAAFVCGGGKDGNGQHFTCSRECAITAAKACIDEHLVPRHEEHVQRKLAAGAVTVTEAPAPAPAPQGGRRSIAPPDPALATS